MTETLLFKKNREKFLRIIFKFDLACSNLWCHDQMLDISVLLY